MRHPAFHVSAKLVGSVSSVTVFFEAMRPDTRKAGGAYMEISGRIKKLLPHEGLIIMEDDTRVKVENVVKVNLELG